MGSWGKSYERVIERDGKQYRQIVKPHYPTPTFASKEDCTIYVGGGLQPDIEVVINEEEICQI